MENRKIIFPGRAALPLVRLALKEDTGRGDATASLIPPGRKGKAVIRSKGRGILCGLPLLKLVFRGVSIRVLAQDGAAVRLGKIIAELSGPLRGLLTGERTALNFLCALSGIATLTARYVKAVRGTGAKIYDTRKTLPGLRRLAKYAVRAGGGFNHRMGLYDMVLIKDNHLAAESISRFVARARKRRPRLAVEVEVENLRQFREAVESRPDVIMLDNMSLKMMRRAVRLAREMKCRAQLEASGNVTLKNVRAVAQTGVDRIAIGAITHSAPILDMSMEMRG